MLLSNTAALLIFLSHLERFLLEIKWKKNKSIDTVDRYVFTVLLTCPNVRTTLFEYDLEDVQG